MDGRLLIDVRWSDEADRGRYPKIDGMNNAPVPGSVHFVSTRALQTAMNPVPVRDACERPELSLLLLEESGGQDGGPVRLGDTDLEQSWKVEIAREDRNFPDTDATIPKYAPDQAVTISFNVNFMARVLAVLCKLMVNDPTPVVKMTVPGNPEKAILFEADLAVLMPAKGANGDFAILKRKD